jgi:hypothetical protein
MARKTWVGVLSDFVRNNPRTSAMIAFNLGVWAAQATRKGLGRADLADLPAKLAELLPSARTIGGYVPAMPGTEKRAPVRKRRTVSKKRTAKRRSSKHGAA